MKNLFKYASYAYLFFDFFKIIGSQTFLIGFKEVIKLLALLIIKATYFFGEKISNYKATKKDMNPQSDNQKREIKKRKIMYLKKIKPKLK